MTEQDPLPRSKEEMIARITRAWEDLERTVGNVSDEQLTVAKDTAGWSAKDHLAHLTAWERSMLVLLRDRQPRYVGLGISQSDAETDDDDAINVLIHEHDRNRSLAEIEAERQTVHRALIETLEHLSEEDLMRPCAYFVPGASNEPVYGFVNGNTWGHIEMHRPWIEELLDSGRPDR